MIFLMSTLMRKGNWHFWRQRLMQFLVRYLSKNQHATKIITENGRHLPLTLLRNRHRLIKPSYDLSWSEKNECLLQIILSSEFFFVTKLHCVKLFSVPMFQTLAGSHLYLSKKLWLPLCLWPIAVLSLKFSLFYTPPWLTSLCPVPPNILEIDEIYISMKRYKSNIGPNIFNKIQCHCCINETYWIKFVFH